MSGEAIAQSVTYTQWLSRSKIEMHRADSTVLPSWARSDEPRSAPPPTNPGSDALVLRAQGILENGDLIAFQDGSLYDEYPIEGTSGERLTIRLESSEFDPYLMVIGPGGDIVARHDDISPHNSNASLDIVLPASGVYRVIANGYSRYSRGRYTLSVHRTHSPNLAPSVLPLPSAEPPEK